MSVEATTPRDSQGGAPPGIAANPDQPPLHSVACTHCGLSVPLGLVVDGAAHQFCCAGCRSAFDLIRAHGLDDYYSIFERVQSERRRASGHGSTYDELDDESFAERYVRTDGNTSRCEMVLEGLHCAACVWLVERLPLVVDGVSEARVNLTRRTVQLEWLTDRVRLSQIGRALDGLGYAPHPWGDRARAEAQQQENRSHLIRIAVAGACAGNAMLIAVALYAGMFASMEAGHSYVLRLASAGLGWISLLWPGRVFFRSAWAAIRTRTPHMDLPVALGLAVGGTTGTINAVTGRGEVYFDSLSVLVFLLLVGRWLQYRQQRMAADSVALLAKLTPQTARRVEHGEVRRVSLAALRPDDIVEVLPGELVPADGHVVEGRSAVDQSLLTGESVPVGVNEGDNLTAGATNCEGPLKIRVAATGGESRLGRLMQMVEQATVGRSPLVQWADRIAGYFVVTVVLLAAVTVVLWSGSGISVAIGHAVALMIVACPCALGLATPLALAVAHGQAARREILIKGGDVLERLAQTGHIWFDKTGVLTVGQMTLQRWDGDQRAKRWVAALERRANHPIGCALADGLSAELGAAAINAVDVVSVKQIAGSGVTGKVAGREISVGSPRWIAGQGIVSSERFRLPLDDILGSGWTPIVVAIDGGIVAVAGVGDRVRDEAVEVVADLKQRGWQVGLLSGDHPQTAARVAEAVGIPSEQTHAALAPEQKLDVIRGTVADGCTMMVGDGVNDAPALAAASVGVAVQGGAEVSLQVAPVYLGQAGLRGVVELIDGARHALGVVRMNLGISLGYNVVAVALAMAGWINPLVAAVLMPLSSLTVLGVSLASRSFGAPR